MNRYIQSIEINKVRHLHDLKIVIPDDNHPHLLVTGKNGSGKTSLLNAVSDHISVLQSKGNMFYMSYLEWIDNTKEELSHCTDPIKEAELRNNLTQYQQWYDDVFGQVKVVFEDPTQIVYQSAERPFITAMYAADRIVRMTEPENPTKPSLRSKWKIGDNASDQFLFFLSDLKIQEALARNEGQVSDADQIKHWFESFEHLLGEIFGDLHLKLIFDYKNYSFHIQSEGKSFKFTELSDGFAAVIDIVSDLILKMSAISNRTMQLYNIPGIVLIDEVETHLHLSLQRQVMPLLTSVFPKIQFIVSTHSPFVLNSIPSATIYDLEHQEVLTDLSDYSYEALTEGYFAVSTRSSYLEQQMNRLRSLLESTHLNVAEQFEIKELMSDFEKIPEGVSPKIVGEYEALKVKWDEKIREIVAHDPNL